MEASMTFYSCKHQFIQTKASRPIKLPNCKPEQVGKPANSTPQKMSPQSEKRSSLNDRDFREVSIEWPLELPKSENMSFIVATVVNIATDYGCDYVRVRKEIHNTASEWGLPEELTPAKIRSVKQPQYPKVRRDGKIQIFVPAPWHYTIECRLIHGGWYFNAHIYAETKTAKIAGKIVEGIATGELTVPDGVNVPANPHVFHASKYPCVNNQDSNDKIVVTEHVVRILPRDELKVPPRRVPRAPTSALRDATPRRREYTDSWRPERRDGPSSQPRERYPDRYDGPTSHPRERYPDRRDGFDSYPRERYTDRSEGPTSHPRERAPEKHREGSTSAPRELFPNHAKKPNPPRRQDEEKPLT